MILYGSSLSPFVRKTLAYAGEKGIELDLQPTGMPNFSPEYLEASPFRKMPALRDGDYTLADSSAIIHYIEAKHPEPALIPADAIQLNRRRSVPKTSPRKTNSSKRGASTMNSNRLITITGVPPHTRSASNHSVQ